MKNHRITIFLLFLLVISVVFPLAVKAQKASFYFNPSSGNYSEGDVFSVDVMISVTGTAINAAEALRLQVKDLKDELAVTDVDLIRRRDALNAVEKYCSNGEPFTD